MQLPARGAALLAALFACAGQTVPTTVAVSKLVGGGSPTGVTTGNANGVGVSALLSGPTGLVYSPSADRLYLQDGANHVIRVIDPISKVVSTLVGLGGTQGAVDGIATNARFRGPHGMSLDDAARLLYVSDQQNNLLRVVNLASNATATLAGGGGGVLSGMTNGVGTNARFSSPFGVAVANGTLYVADSGNSCVRAVALATKTVSTFAGLCGTAGMADGGAGVARYGQMRYLTFDGNQSLYLGDNTYFTIRRLNLVTRVVSTIGGVAGLLGTANGIAAIGRLNTYQEILIDAPGNFAVFSDWSNNNLRALELSSSTLFSWAGRVADSTGGYSDGTSTSARFKNPVGLAYDSRRGLVYAVDCNNAGVRVLVQTCPLGFYRSIVSCIACPIGTFSDVGTSTECTRCPANSTTSAPGAASVAGCSVCAAGTYGVGPACASCPRGHYCPANTTAAARLNCGRGHYCPLGSAAPLPCPVEVPPGGWGAQLAQGPAFLVETASCLAHCFFAAGSGGVQSSCT